MDPVKGSILNPLEDDQSDFEVQTIDTPRLPIDRLRKAALEKGAGGIGDLGSMFRRFDHSGNQKIDLPQFNRGCQEYKLGLTSGETRELFNRIDRHRTGTIGYEEFLAAPNLPKIRQEAIDSIYSVLDPLDVGYATAEDIKRVFRVTNHSKYRSGELTEDQVVQEFTNIGGSSARDRMMRSRFSDHYAYISTTMPCDRDFVKLLNRFWDKTKVRYPDAPASAAAAATAAATNIDKRSKVHMQK